MSLFEAAYLVGNYKLIDLGHIYVTVFFQVQV
jgi:hypothetical protein